MIWSSSLQLRAVRLHRHNSPTPVRLLPIHHFPRPRQALQLVQPVQRRFQVLFEAFLAANVTKSVLHRHAVSSDHAMGVNMKDIDVVERFHEVGARDDLPSFVEWYFR